MQRYKRKIALGLKFIKESHKNPFALAWDYYTLKRKKGLMFNEYYSYCFDQQSDLFRKTFLGRNEQRLYLDYLNPKKYYTLARNKYFTHLLLEEYSIPKAKLYCYYSPEGRYSDQGRTSNDLQSTIAILKKESVCTCVIKATEDSHGNNVFAVKNVEYTDDDAILTLLDNATIKLSNVLGKTALVFEEIIYQSAQFEKFNKTSVNTVRFMTCLYPNGEAKVIATFIKIGRDGAFVDNAGSGGNVDAGVEVSSGKIYDPIIFKGFRETVNIDKHPDSKEQLANVVIENWDKVCAEVCRFQQSMPFVKAVGWDIAITDDGPKVIEMNDFWDTTGQLFIGKGWREEIRECYFRWKEYNSKYNIEYIFGRKTNTLSASKSRKIINCDFRK